LNDLARPPGAQTLLKVQTPSKAFSGLSKAFGSDDSDISSTKASFEGLPKALQRRPTGLLKAL